MNFRISGHLSKLLKLLNLLVTIAESIAVHVSRSVSATGSSPSSRSSFRSSFEQLERLSRRFWRRFQGCRSLIFAAIGLSKLTASRQTSTLHLWSPSSILSTSMALLCSQHCTLWEFYQHSSGSAFGRPSQPRMKRWTANRVLCIKC